ncbi:TatD family hydrolase [Sedimentisphaera salicampi]|uniref:Deoxyribonuclease TatD n=1 Tax=Sedimentisphaera salicampi TaxID=1941349 RepID=A0A1W6LQK4_9BACT|nr:TatD family hydrolase [Sedimentisphaera salicampi]ARN58003.1 Deoxyribonuclease TatD [Sedimentisphaera salicampi]
MSLTDSHVHLQDECFRDDLEEVIQRALSSGVRRMVCCGTNPEDWQRVSLICQDHPCLLPAYGVHPWFAGRLSEGWKDKLHALADRSAAIGEIGLDKLLCNENIEKQIDVFNTQLDICLEAGKPAIVHCLKAFGALMQTLSSRKENPRLLMHSYSGSAEFMRELGKFDVYFSFNGKMLQDNCKSMHRAIRNAPAGKILLETDSPYLTPPEEYLLQAAAEKNIKNNMGYLRNEPANIPLICRGAARLRGVSPEELERQTEENFQILF